MKRVLHVGITAPTYSSEAITKSFVDVFGECVYFDWQAHRYNYGTEGMKKNLLKAASDKFDIIFLHLNNNSEVLSIDDYKELSSLGFVISYTEDVRDDISHFENITPLIGLTIFTNIDDVEKLKDKGIFNAMYLPVSYNDQWYKKLPKTQRYYGEIVFLGNNYVGTNLGFPKAQHRQDMIAVLKEKFGDRFQAYGNGQENIALNPQQAIECYNNAKIAIAHNNFDRNGYDSDRALNAMGCGCFTVPPTWKTFDDLITSCEVYLRNDTLRQALADRQHEDAVKNETWFNRSLIIKAKIDTING